MDHRSFWYIVCVAIISFVHFGASAPVYLYDPQSSQPYASSIYIDADPVYSFDAQPSQPVATGQQPSGPGVALTAGSASFAQNPGWQGDQMMMPPSLGGPYDLDPADYPPFGPSSGYPTGAGPGQQIPSGSGGAVAFVQHNAQPSSLQYAGPAFLSYDVRQPYIHAGNVDFSKLPIALPKLTNSATGTLINTGSADKGQLSASGKTNTNTGPMGALSTGSGTISGQGLGLSATQVNSGQAGTGIAPAGPNAPLSGSSSNNFVNSLQAEKGRVLGDSNTVSRTGANGNAFGSSSGNAFGTGQGLQLTQVANSDSEGSGVGAPGPQPYMARRAWN
ncbi:spidroin-2-like [Paramacrobiotus metropolitanus]|uniref:spidroin-2-like n=1 Tax=Paramacrobiotus metropolitanus TaxID=2943436 RepID=UPI0024459E28|nr:spidroin-2-like [Paramacrobiotus metropolitanus]